MNRKPTWYEKQILDGVDREVGPGGLPKPEEPPAPVEDNDDASE